MPRLWQSLTPRPAFLQVQAEGLKLHTKLLQLQCVAAPSPTPSLHIGLTVSGKHGGAVERNRIKRKWRAVLDATLAEPRWQAWLGNHAVKLVLIPKTGALEAESGQYAEDLRYLLKKLARGTASRETPADET
ncbi:ribonuclease P protein component [bacterium]|nr:ribonuclease P protein component [bacterium]